MPFLKTTPAVHTVPTATLLDVFRTISRENGWCSDAEMYAERGLGLKFEDRPDDFCCDEHNPDFQRFTPVEGSPEKLDAAKVAEAVKYQVSRGYLDRADADRLLALLPEDFRYPPKVTVTAKFTMELEAHELDNLKVLSPRGVRRWFGERVYDGRSGSFDYSA